MSMSEESLLILASRDGQLSRVKQFVEGKCDLNHKDPEEKTALHWACKYGHAHLVEFLIEKGANLEMKDCVGDTPLALAFENSHWNIASCLVNSGCLVNKYGESLLFLFTKKGQVSLVKQLIERKCDLNYKNEDWKGMTALHCACEYGHADIVELLTKEGANLEEKDCNGDTPLAMACRYRHWDIVHCLMNLGCSVTTINENGETLMNLAVRGKQIPIDFVKLLVQRRCDLQAKDIKGRNPLHWASYYGHADVVHYLVKQGAYLNNKDEKGITCLHLASLNGRAGVAKCLINEGANLEEKNWDGDTPLAVAIRYRRWDIVYRLVNSGCSVTAINKNGETSLILAVRREQIPVAIVKLLVQRNCDLEAKDREGRNALHWASCYGHADVVAFLIGEGANWKDKETEGRTAVHLASSYGHTGLVEFLVQEDADLKDRDDKGMTCLHLASLNGRASVAEYLINRGVNLEEKDRNGDTPLAMACKYRRWDIVHCLVNSGCSVTSINKNGETLMILAVQGKQIPIAIVRLLVQRKCDLQAKDREGRNALHWASYYNHADVVEFLVQEGADLNDKDKEGRTGLHLAALYGHTGAVECLVGQGADLKDKKGRAALHLASLNGHAGVVECLVNQGANLEVIDDLEGRNALHWASYYDHLDVVEYVVGLGADLEDKDKEGRTALHLASLRGHAGVVKYLVKQGASLEVIDDLNGDTPLMAACREELRKNVVRDLADKNCCVNTKNKNGQTALHLACGGGLFWSGSKSLDYFRRKSLATERGRDLLYVLRMLVDNGCDIDITDKHGATPFSYFLDLCHKDYLDTLDMSIARKFTSCGAQLDITSVVSKTTILHLLPNKWHSIRLSSYEEEVLDALKYLLSNGANPERQDKKGRFPYELAHGRLRNSLRKALEERRYSRLSKLGVTNPKRIKVCLIGDAGAGKSTLLKSLSRKMEEQIQLLASEIGVDDPTDPDSRTAGVNVVVAHIDQAGELVFCDFAGQENFHKTHSFFFSKSNTIYILVVDLTKSDEEMCASSSFWLSFVKCTTGALSSNSNVLLIGSRGDKRDGRALRRLRNRLILKFKDIFSFSEEHFVLDCRLCGSDDMSRVRHHLGKLKNKCLKKSLKVPGIVENVQSVLLPKLRQLASLPADSKELNSIILIPKSLEQYSAITFAFEDDFEDSDLENFELSRDLIKPLHGSYFISSSYFRFLIDWNVYRGISKEILSDLVQFLADTGEIIEIDGQVIFDPPWLCHNVLGPVMSPDTFPIHMEGVEDGEVSASEIKNVIEGFNKKTGISTEEALKILCKLEICFPIAKGKDLYRIPALIQEKRRVEMWTCNAEMEVYVGRRLQCADDVDIIIPGTMPFLQTRSAVRLDPVPLIWKDGLILQKSINGGEFILDGLIELQERAKGIDVVARGPRFSEKECLDLVTEMVDMVREVMYDRSPATDIVELFLSPLELKNLAERPPAYSLTENEHSASVTTKLGRRKYTEALTNLLVVPRDHYALLPFKIKCGILATLNGSPDELETLGEALGMQVADLPVSGKSAEKLLQKWSIDQGAVLSKLEKGFKKIRCEKALRILYSSGKIQPESKEPSPNPYLLADESNPENHLVEVKHIKALMGKMVGDDDELRSFAMALCCWDDKEASQFLSDNQAKKVRWKFYQLVIDWKTQEQSHATIGRLVRALKKIEMLGKARKILLKTFSLNVSDSLA